LALQRGISPQAASKGYQVASCGAPVERVSFDNMAAPGPTAHSALIFLHGSGDCGEGIAQGLDAVSGGTWASQMTESGIHVVYPDAPAVPYTLAGGATMPVWFDRVAMAYEAPEDGAGLARSLGQVEAEVEKLVAGGVPVERIGVAGFSMGACVALHAGFGQGRFAGMFAMVASMSTFVSEGSCLDAAAAERFKAPGAAVPPPLFMAHGDADPMIKPAWADHTRRRLEESGVRPPAEIKWYKGLGHTLCSEEVQELAAFVTSHLGTRAARGPSDAAQPEE